MRTFGWFQKRGNYGSNGVLEQDALNEYAYTQQYIWESLGQSSATFVDQTHQNAYNNYKSEINDKMDKMAKRPSFDGTTVTIEIGIPKVLTDTNDVLKDYKSVDTTRDNIHFVHNKGDNTLTITASQECSVESFTLTDALAKEIGLIKDGSEDKNTTVYIGFVEGTQDQLYSRDYNDPVTLSVNMTINALGSLVLKKQGENGEPLNGARFLITGPEGYSQEVTVNNEITLDGLKPRVISYKGIIFAEWIHIRCNKL